LSREVYICDMEPIITIRNLSKNYGEKVALNNINLDIYPGQIIGYIGPNGAGKSTTVKILAGIIQDYSGDVQVAGIDLAENVLEVKKKIGYIPELPEMYDLLTPREYLTFIGKLFHLPDELIESRTVKMLSSFGLKDNIDQRMDGFSKGMRQKVLITSGLLHNPQIIIMDEPLSGLDANAVIIVKELLQVLKAEGRTVFYCSHMMDVVERVSDRIVLIDKGAIVADGTIEELRKDSSDSLEKIFAKLTLSEDNTERTGSFASVFKDEIENPTTPHE
jgi:ABC-2 type transport system ATP-binding protein